MHIENNFTQCLFGKTPNFLVQFSRNRLPFLYIPLLLVCVNCDHMASKGYIRKPLLVEREHGYSQ